MMHFAHIYQYGFDLGIKLMAGLLSIGIFLPIALNQNTYCEEDEDCPNILRCCIYDSSHYCCMPNNYVNYRPSYLYLTVRNEN